MNNVVVVGRLVKEVDLKFIGQNGTACANFTIAVDRGYKDETDFIDCQAWGKTAEGMSNYLAKGSQILVNGAIRTNLYQTQEGQKRKAITVNAQSIKFLDTKKKEQSPKGETFKAITDDDIPFNV